jgi:hypothetical protein
VPGSDVEIARGSLKSRNKIVVIKKAPKHKTVDEVVQETLSALRAAIK